MTLQSGQSEIVRVKKRTVGKSTAWAKAPESCLKMPAPVGASLDPSFGPTHRNLVPFAWPPGVLELLPVLHWTSSLLGQGRKECIV